MRTYKEIVKNYILILYKILINLYIRIYLSGMVILGIIILKKRIKDFISGKSR